MHHIEANTFGLNPWKNTFDIHSHLRWIVHFDTFSGIIITYIRSVDCYQLATIRLFITSTVST